MKSKTKKLLIGAFTSLLLSCNLIQFQLSFDAYQTYMLLSLMGSDIATYNQLTNDPSNIGYGRHQYQKASFSSFSCPEIDHKKYTDYFNDYLKELHAYNYSSLNQIQKASYNHLETLFKNQVKYYSDPTEFDVLMNISWINSSGGVVSDFVSTIENYKYRNVQDVKDVIDYLESGKNAIPTYSQFVQKRLDINCPLAKESLDGMKSYLDVIVEQGKDYYLYSFVNNKIETCSFLIESEKNTFKDQASNAIDSFVDGINQLSENLTPFVETSTPFNHSYYKDFGSKGSAYYKYQIETKLGYDNIDVEEYKQELTSAKQDALATISLIDEEIDNLSESLKEEYATYQNGASFIEGVETPEELLVYLQEISKETIYGLENDTEISVKYLDESVANISNVNGYYAYSEIDDNESKEYITINPNIKNDFKTLFFTMSHEGYPGHLYSYAKNKENGLHPVALLLTNLGFAEGWAQYAASTSLDYVANHSDSEAVKLFCQRSLYEMVANYVSNALIDIDINYYFYDVDKIVEQYSVSEKAASRYLTVFSENPGVYAPYGYGFAKMREYHSQTKEILGEKYDEREFNKALLSYGWDTLQNTESLISNYVSETQK